MTIRSGVVMAAAVGVAFVVGCARRPIRSCTQYARQITLMPAAPRDRGLSFIRKLFALRGTEAIRGGASVAPGPALRAGLLRDVCSFEERRIRGCAPVAARPALRDLTTRLSSSKSAA